jgi:hypothetical protein
VLLLIVFVANTRTAVQAARAIHTVEISPGARFNLLNGSKAVLLTRLLCKREQGCLIGTYFLLFCLAVAPNQTADNRK